MLSIKDFFHIHPKQLLKNSRKEIFKKTKKLISLEKGEDEN
jgi:hypothetical protein